MNRTNDNIIEGLKSLDESFRRIELEREMHSYYVNDYTIKIDDDKQRRLDILRENVDRAINLEAKLLGVRYNDIIYFIELLGYDKPRLNQILDEIRLSKAA